MLAFDYDHQDRLTKITYPDNGEACYQYDPDGGLFGNRLKETITNVNNANATGGHPKAYGEYQYVYPDKSNRLARIDYKASGEATFTATKP